MSRESECSDDVTDIAFTDRNLEPAQPLAEETAGPALQDGGPSRSGFGGLGGSGVRLPAVSHSEKADVARKLLTSHRKIINNFKSLSQSFMKCKTSDFFATYRQRFDSLKCEYSRYQNDLEKIKDSDLLKELTDRIGEMQEMCANAFESCE